MSVSKAKQMRAKGETYVGIGQYFNVSPSTVLRWCNTEDRENNLANNRLRQKERRKKYPKECLIEDAEKRQRYNLSIRNSNRKYKLCHPEVGKAYRKKYTVKKSAAHKERLRRDPRYKLACALRIRMYHALKGHQKSGSAVSDLGCSITEFKGYLETKFYGHMVWENYGSYWHIDHVFPLSAFNLNERSHFLKAAHFTNMQPLLVYDNLSKADSYNQEDFEEYMRL